ncbi:uncharacterized protein DEA37_0011406 [Paragonimus westermani]|uniref:Integrase catalytic domain-containing protein n=1 Tax=Paragonimus westermani TaxID=34504 RepID=A0A5J4NFU7_9TREM|nr:uncharacterized protein DEA37_0011406 [Paragonimus westermani]
MDFAGPFNGQTYLVIVDAYTKWPEVHNLRQPNTDSTIQKLSELFSCFGLPETVVTDNGSQFTSSIFESYCQRLGIQHMRSPVYHPQSNGQAERFVDTLKRALLKARGEGPPSHVQTFLTNYRTTPNPNVPDGKSPAECMFNRKLRTAFDIMTPQLNRGGGRDAGMERQYNRRQSSCTILQDQRASACKHVSWTDELEERNSRPAERFSPL